VSACHGHGQCPECDRSTSAPGASPTAFVQPRKDSRLREGGSPCSASIQVASSCMVDREPECFTSKWLPLASPSSRILPPRLAGDGGADGDQAASHTT
jgi:hypothetical protein